MIFPMAVTRCVCFKRSFRELRDLAAREGWARVAEITRATGCGSGCGSCVPYLQAMLSSGETCFAVRRAGEPITPCEPDPWDPA